MRPLHTCRLSALLRCRNVACVFVALLGLCRSATAQESRSVWDVSASRALWQKTGSGSESGAQSLLETFQRHTSVDSYREAPAAGLRLYHYTAALKLDLPPIGSRWKVYTDLGLGATRLRTNDQSPHYADRDDLSETFLSLRSGLTIEYAFSNRLRTFVTAREYLYLDSDDAAVTVDGLNDQTQILESGTWSFPLSFGVRLRID